MGVTDANEGKNTGMDKMNVKQPHPRLLQYVQNPIQYAFKKPCMHACLLDILLQRLLNVLI